MKLQYKYQGFQRDAANAVVKVFRGQPKQGFFAPSKPIDIDHRELGGIQLSYYAFGNEPIQLSAEALSQNIRSIQKEQDLQPIEHL